MPTAVFDSSAILRSLLQGPHFERVDHLLMSFNPVMPNLSRYEIANVLRTYVSVGEMKVDSARDLYHHAMNSFYFTDDTALLRKALDLGLVYNHSVYDMVFVVLSESFGVPFVTADKKLATVAADILQTPVHDVNIPQADKSEDG